MSRGSGRPARIVAMNEKTFRLTLVVLLVAAVSVLFVAMIRRFLMTILLAAIFSGLARPLYTRLLAAFRGRKNLASLCTLVLIVAMIVGPFLAFLGVLASQAYQIAQSVGPWIEKQVDEPDNFTRLVDRFPALARLEPYRAEIIDKLGQAVGSIGNFLFAGLSDATRGTITFLFHVFLLLYTMFFFLIDGKAILDKILSYVPLSNADKNRLSGKFVTVSRATIKGTLVIGIVQGGLAGLGFAIAGLQGSVFWGTMMTVLSIIPGLGTAIVWVPGVIYLLASGHVTAGILLGLFCALIVGSIDNFLRPRLVGRDVKMHPLLILFGTLGGVFFFGVVGVIVGPIIAAVFVTIWDICGVVFSETVPTEPQDAAPPGADAGA